MGTATILIAPGVYRQCAVQSGGRITYQGGRRRAPRSSRRETCEDKAALVLRGQGSVVDGLVFRGYSVSDGNGAGIRTEMGDLTVINSMFLDSQEGILGGEPTDQKIVIDRSTFSGPRAMRDGELLALDLPAEQGQRDDHQFAFRTRHRRALRQAARAADDDHRQQLRRYRRRKTNYMIDLPEGGTGLIARNTFVQGAAKENDGALVVIAAEAQDLFVGGPAHRGQRRAHGPRRARRSRVRGGLQPRSTGDRREPAERRDKAVRDAVAHRSSPRT